MQTHEYSVIGHNRASVGRYLAIAAGTLTSLTALLTTTFFRIIEEFGFSAANNKLIIIPISTALFYAIGYSAFDLWIWKSKLLFNFIKIPNLNGAWKCTGRTIDINGKVTYEWSATVRISQTWEKIRIYLDTGQSKSASVAASLIHEPGRGYILMYSYRNEPRAGEVDLRAHIGYAELMINEMADYADGDYFNNKGRLTSGRMTLKKISNETNANLNQENCLD